MPEALEKLAPAPRAITPADEVGISEFLDDYKHMSLPSSAQPDRCRIVVDRTLDFVRDAEELWLSFRVATALATMRAKHPEASYATLAKNLQPQAWLPASEDAPQSHPIPQSIVERLERNEFAFPDETMHYFRLVLMRSGQGNDAQIKGVLKAIATLKPIPLPAQQALEKLFSTHLSDTINAALSYGTRLEIDYRLQLHLALAGLAAQISPLITSRCWESTYYWTLEASAGMLFGIQDLLKFAPMPTNEKGWKVTRQMLDLILVQRYIPVPDLPRLATSALDHWSRLSFNLRRTATRALATPYVLEVASQNVEPQAEPEEPSSLF